MSDVPASVVREVLERAFNDLLDALVCEACGGVITGGYAKHHRHPRGRGGSRMPWIHTAPNIMVVHGDLQVNCHNLTEYSIHQNPTRSYRLGHTLRYGTDPASASWVVEPRLRDLRA